MADERPDRNSGRGGNGPGDQGHRGGRRRGFRGRHGGGNGREGQEARQPGREGQAERDQRSRGSGDSRSPGDVRSPGDSRSTGDVRAPDESRQGPAEARQGFADPRPRPEEQSRLRPEDMPSCPICGKPVYDLSTAVSAARESGEPAHFDCVLERVAASETLAAGEKVVYLGSGAFGVVELKDKNEGSFAVKRRIQWEKEGEKKDWRKSLSARIANL